MSLIIPNYKNHFIWDLLVFNMGTAKDEVKPKVEEPVEEVKEVKKDPAVLTIEDIREHCR